MNYTSSGAWSPKQQPKSLRRLLEMIAFVSIVSSLLDGIFVYYSGTPGPQSLLSLSWYGLSHWQIWQPLSYLFVLSNGNGGLSLSFFWELLISLYILWVFGGSLLDRIGTFSFFRFFFLTGILTGLFTVLCMPLFNQYPELAGPGAPLLAILTVWTMLNLESEILLFFLIPIKARWLFLGMIGILLLINLSHLNFIGALFGLFSILIGYFYGTLIWGLSSPFSFTHYLDQFLINLGEKLRSLLSFKKSTELEANKKTTIFDFSTGDVMEEDDLFMEKMLKKISEHGEQSLSWGERSRMKKISEKKARRKR